RADAARLSLPPVPGATGAVQPEFRDPGAAIARNDCGFSRSHPFACLTHAFVSPGYRGHWGRIVPRVPRDSWAGSDSLGGFRNRFAFVARLRYLGRGWLVFGTQWGSKPTPPGPSPFTARGSPAPTGERSNRQILARIPHSPRERRCL